MAMTKRRPISRKGSKRLFAATANRTNVKNVGKPHGMMRGGDHF